MITKKKQDGFTSTGCYKCADCGKLTRETKDNVTNEYCVECEEIQMHENMHSDNDFPNNNCGSGKDCLLLKIKRGAIK